MSLSYELSYTTTIIVGIIISVILNVQNFILSRINIISILLGYFFFAFCFPLGHDTLNYKTLILDGYLPRYGVIWDLLYKVSIFFNEWKLVHLIAYFILLYSFVSISRLVENSSLFFIVLVLSPAIGFDFLSIIRQGLATAFIILSVVANRRNSKYEYLFYLLAILTHVTSAVYPIYLILSRTFQVALKSKAKFFFLLSIVLTSLISIAAIIIKYELINPTYFIDLYVTNKDSEASGKFVFLFWIIVLISPIFLAFTSNIGFGFKYALGTYFYFIAYIFFWSISPPLARLMWYFLPALFYENLLKCEKQLSREYLFFYKALLIVLLIISSSYGLMISHNNFWYGFYE